MFFLAQHWHSRHKLNVTAAPGLVVRANRLLVRGVVVVDSSLSFHRPRRPAKCPQRTIAREPCGKRGSGGGTVRVGRSHCEVA